VKKGINDSMDIQASPGYRLKRNLSRRKWEEGIVSKIRSYPTRYLSKTLVGYYIGWLLLAIQRSPLL